MDSRDSECIARCLDGHPEAYRLLVERYQGPLVSWLTGRLRNRLAAEDVAQEAFGVLQQGLTKAVETLRGVLEAWMVPGQG